MLCIVEEETVQRGKGDGTTGRAPAECSERSLKQKQSHLVEPNGATERNKAKEGAAWFLVAEVLK